MVTSEMSSVRERGDERQKREKTKGQKRIKYNI